MKSSLFTPLGSLFIAAWALVKTEIVHIKNTANLPQCISVTAFRALDVVSKSILNGMEAHEREGGSTYEDFHLHLCVFHQRDRD